MCINEIITNKYNNIISIYKTKCLNVMYIYKAKYTRKYIRIVTTF